VRCRSERPLLSFFVVIPEGNLLLYVCCHSHRKSAFPIPQSATIPPMPSREYHFWIYILASRSRNPYIGITNNLKRRVIQHRKQVPGAYTSRYAIHRLVHFEYFQYVQNAIAREKQLKHWTRQQKIALIEQTNPAWEDLYPKLLAQPETPQAKGICFCTFFSRQNHSEGPAFVFFGLSSPKGICFCLFFSRQNHDELLSQL
jgi:putative endonuclease